MKKFLVASKDARDFSLFCNVPISLIVLNKTTMKKLLILIALVVCTCAAQAQTAASDSTATNEPVQTEKVTGFWDVMGYVGGKLTKELGTRLNIGSDEKETVSTEVKVELGWIKFTRVENRPVKD
ncbi:MAG: hypothetical protein P8L71_07590 [Flavobacteriales bacterium]|nr:hypothetical protein [Flavobacteriales bacterium]